MFLIYSGTPTYTENTGLGSLSLSTNAIFQASEIRGEELLNLYPALFAAVTTVSTILSDDSVTTAKILNAAVTSAKIAPGVKQVDTITFTTAELLAGNTTPKQLVAAPAVGSYVVVDKITASLVYVSAAYATNTTLEFRYTNGSGAKVTADIASLLTATGNKIQTVGAIEAETTLTSNAAIVALVATGNPITGNSDIKITVEYRILSI